MVRGHRFFLQRRSKSVNASTKKLTRYEVFINHHLLTFESCKSQDAVIV